MRKLLKYLKPYWLLAILAPITMIGEVVLDLIQPKLMERIVDNGILSEVLSANEKTRIVIIYGLIMLGALAIGGLCGILSAYFASKASNMFGSDLRKDLFAHIVDLSFEQVDNITTGSLVTRITNDVTNVQDFISMVIRMFVRTIIMFVGGIIFMFLTSTKFSIILAIAMPFELIFVLFFMNKAKPFFKQIQKKVDKVNSVVQENVNGIRVVKAYTQEKNEIKRFDEANVDLSNTSLKVFKLFAYMSPFMMIMLNAVIIVIIYFGGLEISNNVTLILAGNEEVMSVGKLMSGLTYVSMVLMSLLQLSMSFQHLTRAQISAARINEVLESYPIVKQKEDTLNNDNHDIAVEFKNVCFKYPTSNDNLVIKDLNIKIKKGESIAILGSTGSGKTSIVSLIPRFYDTTSGEVFIDGINVKDYDLKVLRKKISIVLQRTELFAGTIFENICWGKEDATIEDVIRVTKISQAYDFINSNPEKYDTMIKERGSSLSGGQKQRIAIARALIRDPKILIFDDSTSALDLKTEALLYKELKANYDDTTIIIIAQRVATAKNADKIAVIDQGQLVAFGNHNELIETSPIYQEIYNSQLKRDDKNE